MKEIPVITIDGPSGTGKGTVARLLAEHLAWHLLDSGALYRALAWSVIQHHVEPTDIAALKNLLEQSQLDLRTHSPSDPPEIWCDNQDISHEIRQEACGNMASKIAPLPVVRAHLLHYQRMMRQKPGLVADGRDMGSVVFPDASVKFYLDASSEIRAQRRYKQLKEKGIDVSLPDIQHDLALRDHRDENREVSPMKVMPDMVLVDTTHLPIEEVMSTVVATLQERLPCLN